MPLIRVTHAAHYDQTKKDDIMREVTRAYAQASGCDPAKVWLILEEVNRDDWASGGTALSNVKPK